MLSRTADAIYWMSRQIERAENLARLLDVLQQMSLLPGMLSSATLRSPLRLSGSEDDYAATGQALEIRSLMRFCTLDARHPASIFCNLRAARDNALCVRGNITTEMWETINATWLELRDMKSESQSLQGYRPFLEWVKERSHLFRGVTFATVRRNDTFHFCRLGTWLERADNTLRILLVHTAANTDSASNWEILLHSLSAQENYRQRYGNTIGMQQVMALLLLDAEFPRSLLACCAGIEVALAAIQGDNGYPPRRLCAEMLAALRFTRIEQELTAGVAPMLSAYLQRLTTLGQSIQNAYMGVGA